MLGFANGALASLKCEPRLADEKVIEYYNANFSSNGKPEIHKNERKEEAKEAG